jgi:hypothetical protein
MLLATASTFPGNLCLIDYTREINEVAASPNDKKRHVECWYPTQAKTGLEWGTQPSLVNRVLGMTILLCPQELQRGILGPATELSSRQPRLAVGPERTRISCYTALTSSHVCGFP